MAAAAGGRGSGSEDGDVPAATRLQAYAWCREFLAGSWKLIGPDEFGIWPIGGGLSNLLYKCALPEHVQSVGDEPRQVLLRVYGAILQGVDSLVLESVMFAILAERALGPRLFGVFPQGRLEQYLPSRRLRTEELRDPRVSAEIAITMARFHGMAMPFNKEPKWLFGTMEGYLRQIAELTFSEPAQLQQLEQLRGYNLEQEMRSLRSLPPPEGPSAVPCPHPAPGAGILSVVLSFPLCPHVPGVPSISGPPLCPSCVPLVLACLVSPVGFDLGNHFCEWVYSYSHEGWPCFQAHPEHFPSRQQQLHFIRHYLSALSGGPGRAPQEERARLEEEMLREIERFTLASHFFWGLWSVVQAKISTIHFGYLDYAQSRFQAYFQHKARCC
ncbi:choline/ethanolamine kinase [Camarhynchus parvulus]|uniref:choline/ethanolamine kinase n=1 Tax=Geospiza parvula TaxID=87175 RepID=UPI0012383276|nr:choline/ethanolamine kinase [Camarhynchus parvulus]